MKKMNLKTTEAAIKLALGVIIGSYSLSMNPLVVNADTIVYEDESDDDYKQETITEETTPAKDDKQLEKEKKEENTVHPGTLDKDTMDPNDKDINNPNYEIPDSVKTEKERKGIKDTPEQPEKPDTPKEDTPTPEKKIPKTGANPYACAGALGAILALLYRAKKEKKYLDIEAEAEKEERAKRR